MASVDILVLDQFSLMCVAATVEPLRAANRVAAQPLYRWRLLSRDGSAPTSTSGITVAVEGAFAPDEARDVLFVVGVVQRTHRRPGALCGAPPGGAVAAVARRH